MECNASFFVLGMGSQPIMVMCSPLNSSKGMSFGSGRILFHDSINGKERVLELRKSEAFVRKFS